MVPQWLPGKVRPSEGESRAAAIAPSRGAVPAGRLSRCLDVQMQRAGPAVLAEAAGGRIIRWSEFQKEPATNRAGARAGAGMSVPRWSLLSRSSAIRATSGTSRTRSTSENSARRNCTAAAPSGVPGPMARRPLWPGNPQVWPRSTSLPGIPFIPGSGDPEQPIPALEFFPEPRSQPAVVTEILSNSHSTVTSAW